MLSPNNLPALRDRPGSKLIICTTRDDWDILRLRPLVSTLAEFVEPHVIFIPPPADEDAPLLHMSKGHQLAVRIAYQDGAVAGFLAPDLLVSDGLVKKAVTLLESGKKAVFCPALRFGMESTLEAIQPRLLPDQPACLSPNFLSKVAVRSLHSEILRYDFKGAAFDNYPIWSYWRVPDRDGIIMYTTSWAMILGDYGAIQNHNDALLEQDTIDGFYIYQNFGHLSIKHEIVLLDDSWNGMFFSLTPESELTYFPLREIASNRKPIIGTLKRLIDMNRFYRSDVLDPLRRQFYGVPFIIHGEGIDNRYWATIAETCVILGFVRRAPQVCFQIFENIRDRHQNICKELYNNNHKYLFTHLALYTLSWKSVKRRARGLVRAIVLLVIDLIVHINRMYKRTAGKLKIIEPGTDSIDTHVIRPLLRRYGRSGLKEIIRRMPTAARRSFIYRARIKPRKMLKTMATTDYDVELARSRGNFRCKQT